MEPAIQETVLKLYYRLDIKLLVSSMNFHMPVPSSYTKIKVFVCCLFYEP